MTPETQGKAGLKVTWLLINIKTLQMSALQNKKKYAKLCSSLIAKKKVKNE